MFLLLNYLTHTLKNVFKTANFLRHKSMYMPCHNRYFLGQILHETKI